MGSVALGGGDSSSTVDQSPTPLLTYRVIANATISGTTIFVKLGKSHS